MAFRTPDTRPSAPSTGRYRKAKAVAGVLLAGSALTACFPAARPQELPKRGIVVDKHIEKISKCFDAGNLDDDNCSVAGETTRYEYHLTLAACSFRGTVRQLADSEYLQQAALHPSDYQVTAEGNADITPGMDPAKDYPCAGDINLPTQDQYDGTPKGTIWLPSMPIK